MKRSLLLLVLMAMLAACGNGGGAPAPAAPVAAGGGNAEAGKALFAQTLIGTQPGCVTCHSLIAGDTIVGPALAGVAARAGNTVSGESAEQYIRTSILEPNAHVADGFAQGIMQSYKDALSEQQLDDLVAYLLTLK